MKTFLIILFFAFIATILFQSFTKRSTEKTRQQPYTVVSRLPEFEIRHYPAATFATVVMNSKSYKQMAYPGFRKLAGYIFGGNANNLKIAMTAPVHMQATDSSSTMSFVMPSGFNKENLPSPDDSNIKIQTSSEEHVAAISFGGYADDKKIKSYTESLRKTLNENGISHSDNFRFLGYNPPYQFWSRRNEIIVQVDISTVKK
jgi:hypothetical protein